MADKQEKKVILDTDIGSDIDDAVALAYLLKHPQCHLMGITTVSGQPVERAKLASALCIAAGKPDIPIYPGTESPILAAQKQPEAIQAPALANWKHASSFPKGEAVEFLRRTIRQNPGEISLLAIGPMTNIGLLFATDPEIPGLLKELVLMCGVFENEIPHLPHGEWNAVCDPHATAVVYRARSRVHRSIGLDVTYQVRLSPEEVEQRFTAPILQPVKDFARLWFRHAGAMVFHDPLAAATLFRQDICGFESGQVDVDLESRYVSGMTLFRRENNGPHQVAVTVDRDAFLQEYFDVVGR